MSETATIDGLTRGEDGRMRCAWHGTDTEYRRYHDEEWGRPSADDDRLFEKLCLEGFQAGLSWLTILRKRPAFREVFQGFGIDAVAAMGEADIERIVQDPRIVRHRGKIVSAVNNARRAAVVRADHGSLAAFLWAHEPPAKERPETVSAEFVRANPVSPASTRLSKALKTAGFTFVGPTTVYAFMQSMGFVNDHLEGCCVREACEAERRAFVRPR
ncbi:DNA-3-methyladenine glycosylase I [Aurantimonas sp. VKM B-3413]|uniref:DNA-3-methyladenine glycosylase I n=1 Tax=Aurantimonas sp. VKM B-3413 TaxID=2779401 RepID=UPI001E51B561|nr:DNA-3-methyladenine glycosylase I [Aurantimonas sp. VKM B-3413]MCB8838721.1 DNA-3-methyladenine glycosylase I [Aurantimonas sp. VKM B-3413]